MNAPTNVPLFEIPDYVLDAIKSGPIPTVRDTTDVPDDDLSDGEAVIRFAEEHLVVPEGPLVGQPLELDIYQKVFILAVFDNDATTGTAILSVARRNGKTFLVAVILLAFIVGPLRQKNTSMCSAANARDQAAIAFDLMKLMLDMSKTLAAGTHYKYVETSKTIVGLKQYVRYRAISAEAKSGHGKAYKIILLDEAGQIEAENTPFTDMLETSMSNYDDALYLLISTQAASDASFFSQQIDNAVVQQEPTTVCHVYAADEDCDMDDRKQWLKANPGLGKFVSEKKMAQKVNEARHLPSKANGIKNLNFNQRVSQMSLMLSAEVWKKNQRPQNMEARHTAEIDIGLDLSQVNDLTAATACWRDENGEISVEVRPYLPAFGIEAKELRDKVPYRTWETNGDLKLIPGPRIEYEYICQDLAIQYKGCKIRSIQADPYRLNLFMEAAKKTDFYGMVGEWVEVRQGFISFGVRVDAFEREALVGNLRTGSAPALNMGASQAVVGEDAAGNRKPLKNKSIHRIDALVAAIMGVFPNSDGHVNNTFDAFAMVG